jgi:SAM domain (Sterile alpha motif)
MQEIVTRLGLPDYAGAFAENGIHVSVLPHLTDQVFKDIGVLLGQRRSVVLFPASGSTQSQSIAERV